MIPQLQLGKTVFDTDFSLGRPSRALVALASTMIGQLTEFTEARRANAASLSERLQAAPDLLFPRATTQSQPVYLRYPILLPDRGLRDSAIESLGRAGIGATGSYPLSLGDVPELRGRIATADSGYAGGQSVAARILTLPTHPYVTTRDLEVTSATLQTLLQRSSSRLVPRLAAGADL
jgi:dTDP-4-amino-4,6-dideoxygalactose transaminase